MINKIFKKILSVSIAASLILSGTYLIKQKFVARAEVPTIPENMFITKEDLLNLCTTTNSGNGLLATGTASDKELFINFGTRPEGEVKYREGSQTLSVAGNQAMTWRVAGTEKNSLVLFSKEPMMSAKSLDDSSDSRFQVDRTDKKFIPESTEGYHNTQEKDVYPNHWGASNLRAKLQELVSKYFKGKEEGMLEKSTVKTQERKVGALYETTDKLYAASSPGMKAGSSVTTIAVGENTTRIPTKLLIYKTYWHGDCWLRDAEDKVDSYKSLCTQGQKAVNVESVDSTVYTGSAACRITLTDVLFSSAASGSSAGSNFSTIEPNTPMALRLEDSGGSNIDEGSSVSVDGTTLTYTAAADEKLVVIATASDGATYQYAVEGDGSEHTLDVSTAAGLPALSDFAGKAWIEKPFADGSQLIYAAQLVGFSGTTPVPEIPDPEDPSTPDGGETPSNPDGETPSNPDTETPDTDDGIEVLSTTIQINGVNQKILVRDINKVLPTETQLKAQVVANQENLDVPNFNVEHQFHYEITLVDAQGNPLPMPLSSNVELLFEVIEGLDANDLEVVLAQLGDDIQFEESLVNIDDTQYVGVWTNHFSPYTLFDELTAEEKAAEDQIKTGDQVSLFIISGVGLIMTLALGLMLRINSNKKKFYE